MAQTNVNIPMDESLKTDFDTMCNELGLNMSVAINIFAKTVVRERAIPFPIAINNPNAETLAAIDDVNNNRNMSRPFSSVKELMEDLDADD